MAAQNRPQRCQNNKRIKAFLSAHCSLLQSFVNITVQLKALLSGGEGGVTATAITFTCRSFNDKLEMHNRVKYLSRATNLKLVSLL